MPAAGVGTQVFEPAQVGFESPEVGGAGGALTNGIPRWNAQWTLATRLTTLQSDEWRAFLASLRGSQRTFLGRDFERPFPRLYSRGFGGMTRHSGGAFDGSASSWSQSIAADGQASLTLNGLPTALQISTGDYCDFRWTTGGVARRSLVRALQNATASGGSVTFGIEPAVPLVTSGSAVAHLDNPACVMRVVTAQTNVTEMDRRRVAGARIFAYQDIRA